MRTAIFSTEFWEDDIINELSRDEKLFYIFVVTNPKRNTSRIFKCTDTVLRKTGDYTADELKALKQSMEEKSLLFFFGGWIVIGDIGYVKPNRGKKSYQIELQEIKKIPVEIIDFYDKLLLNGSITVMERISISNNKDNNNIFNNDSDFLDSDELEESENEPKPHKAQNDSQNPKGIQTIANDETEAVGAENGRQVTNGKPSPAPKTAKTAFIKPTIAEIAEYCKQRGNNVNPEKFYHHYESNGWKIGGRTKMVSWKSAVITWEGNNFGNQRQPMSNVLKTGDNKASKIADRIQRG